MPDPTANNPSRLHRLELGHRLLEPPSEIAPPIVDPQIQTLNLHALAWPNFQKLVVRIARDVEGHREAFEYGTPGQAQHGLDVIAIGDDTSVHAYQARDVETFSEADLERTVADFAAGKRPYDPSRFVIVVACNTDRTQLRDKLKELRGRHQDDFAIDLYGDAMLSDLLREQPDIVQQFFGRATAERFCVGVAPSPSGQSGQLPEMPSMQVADAVLRGPVEALGQQSLLEEADRIGDTCPAEAAKIYSDIAEKLFEAGWPGHELVLKRRAAGALAAAGETRAAAEIVCQLFWRYLDLGAESESQILRHELKKLAERTPEDEILVSSARTVNEAHDAAGDPLDRLNGLASAVDALAAGSEGETEALLLLCELALTSEQPELILARAQRVAEVARTARSSADHPSLGTRLRLCLADATGEWTELLSDVRSRNLSPPDIALILGRRGRFLAWDSKPDGARDAFSQAIERGVLLAANSDALEWIHATRYLGIRYGPLSGLVNEAYRRIQGLDAAGSRTRLYHGLTRQREKVLRNLHDEKYPAAADAGRRFLRECVVAGHWGSEFEAHGYLGDLYAITGVPDRAVRHYIRSGAHKKLESLLRDGPYIDVRADLSRSAPWERAAAFRAVVAEADLVPDDDVDEIVASALADAQAVADGRVVQSGSAPELWASAIAALGALVERAAGDLAGQVLHVLSPLVDRDAGKYRFTDDDHIKALAGVIRGHDALQDDALAQIAKAMAGGGHFADVAMKHAGDLLLARNDTAPMLERLAMAGSENACLLLALRGDKSDVVLRDAERAFDRVMKRPQPKGGTITFGTTLPRDAQLIGVLRLSKRNSAARRLMQIAEDTMESDTNRADALEAISALGNELSMETRTELYIRAMKFVSGKSSQSGLRPDLREEPHPLSRYRLDFSPGPLEAYGLRAAARLAQSEDEIDTVVDKAVSMIASSDGNTRHRLASVLGWLSGPRLVPSLAVLAGQSDASLRALAAVLWVHDPNRTLDLGMQLASDSDVLVRRSLASEIGLSQDLELDNPVVLQLMADTRYSVRVAIGARPADTPLKDL